jgi:hypothetical protein
MLLPSNQPAAPHRLRSPAPIYRGPALIRTRRTEFHEPGVVEACCCVPGLRADPTKYSSMADAVRRVLVWGDGARLDARMPADAGVSNQPTTISTIP